MARPSAFALRATADKSRRRCALPQDEVEGNCKPHGEERAQARVSNHGPLAPPSPAARPSRAGFAGRLRTRMRGIADLMVRSARSARLEPWAAEGVDRRIRCNQQRIYKRFTSMAACSVATRPSPNEKSRPAAAHVVAFICDAMA